MAATTKPTKKEMDRLRDELYALDVELDSLETKRDTMRSRLLEGMDAWNVEKLPGDGFYIQRMNNVKYKMPSPQDARKALGPLAEQFIHETVHSGFRTAISPEMAEKLCPVVSSTPYVKLIKDKK